MGTKSCDCESQAKVNLSNPRTRTSLEPFNHQLSIDLSIHPHGGAHGDAGISATRRRLVWCCVWGLHKQDRYGFTRQTGRQADAKRRVYDVSYVACGLKKGTS